MKNRRIKILLMFPPGAQNAIFKEQTFPYGLACIASSIPEDLGLVKIYPGPDHRAEEVVRCLEEYRPDLVGISCDSANRINCFNIARTIKQRNRDIKVVLGGIHATVFHGQIAGSVADIDFIVRGEGEATFNELLSCLITGKDVVALPGVTFKRKGKTMINPARPFLKNIDVLPFISYELFDMPKITNYNLDPWVLQISRGCPFGCSFCASVGFWERTYRVKSPQRVTEEVLRLKSRYKISRFSFSDQSFTCAKRQVRDICRWLIDKKMNMKWQCLSKVETVDRPLLELMREAGCEVVQFGVESFSDRILKLMKKGYPAKEAVRVLNLTNEVGIKSVFKILLGFPGESEETLKETWKAFEKLKKGVTCGDVGIFEPHPGSPVYPYLEKHALVNDALWFTNFKMSDFVRLNYKKHLTEAIYRTKREIEGLAGQYKQHLM